MLSIKINEFTQIISAFSEQFADTDAYEMANKIASESGILTELYQDKSPENLSRYENTQELLNAIRDFSITAKEEGSPRWFTGIYGRCGAPDRSGHRQKCGR